MKKDRDLIFDVGLHKGEDTAYYLQKGFKVVAFEANPDLIAFCKEKFSDAIQSGRLKIVEGAIVDREVKDGETISFFVNEDNSVWGTVVEEWSERNEIFGTSSKKITVPAVNFKNCLKEHGIPYYIKIDIEGMDVVCLQALLEFDEKPDYVSIESEKVSFDKLEKEFDLFEKLGYDKFNLVNQAEISKQKEPKDTKEKSFLDIHFESGSSGLFGTDLRDGWISKGEALKKYRWIFIGYKLWGDYSKIKNNPFMRRLRGFLQRRLGTAIPGWYDTHAKHKSA
jgi:FkbM family methyltransferase